MRRLHVALRSSHRLGQSGQALVLFAGGLAVFCGLVGLSVDVGLLVSTRTDLQKQADAAALAGAQDLPNANTATSAANAYISRNNGLTAEATVAISQTYTANDTITVTARKRVNYAFVKVLGLAGANVSATAKVRTNSYTGGTGVRPWGLIASNNNDSKLLQNPCYLGQQNGVPQFKQNTQCTLKYGAGTSAGGDFGALAIDGTGANDYSNGIAKGSKTPVKVGDQLEAQTGNMQGKTDQGIDELFDQPPPPGCPGNSRNDVLVNNPDESVSIRPGCEASPRIVIIPVVNQINNPAKSTVLGFAYMFLTGTSGSGGHMQIKGEFVKFVTELPNSVYQSAPGAGATMIKLIQ